MKNIEYKELEWGSAKEQITVIGLSLFAGLIAKLPVIAGIDEDFFFMRNISFIFFPVLSLYFMIKNRVALLKSIGVFTIIGLSALYINLLPERDGGSDTMILASLHMPFFMWTITGYCFSGGKIKTDSGGIEYLRFNGELAVIVSFILISGAALSLITISLFELISIRIEDFYFSNIAVWGLAATPLVGAYLVNKNIELVKNVPVVIARIFTPFLLLMLIVYLGAIVVSGKNPYSDREFLLLFNILLVGVMAIILFSISESFKSSHSKFGVIVLTSLSVVAIVVNLIALSAIIMRIMEWGLSPNRAAVLGSNMLILTNLMFISGSLFRSIKSPEKLADTEKNIARFLPIYSFWAAIVIFLFPLLFR